MGPEEGEIAEHGLTRAHKVRRHTGHWQSERVWLDALGDEGLVGKGE